jgi:hypothetical protein
MPHLLASQYLDAILAHHVSLFPLRDRLAVENGAMRAIITSWAAVHPECLSQLEQQAKL